MPGVEGITTDQGDDLLLLYQLVGEAERAIQGEQARTGQPWSACFGSVIFAYETALQGAKDVISESRFIELSHKLEAIKGDLVLVKESETSGATLTEIKKQSMLSELAGLSP